MISAGIFIILIVLAAVVPLWAFGVISLPRRTKKAVSFRPKLSEPAKQLVEEYNELPPESRPFPDIVSMVLALDEKTSFEGEQVRADHFNDNVVEGPYGRVSRYDSLGYSFTWKKCGLRRHKCDYSEYSRLHLAIAEVAASVKVKERALAESRHAGDTLMIAEFEKHLRAQARENEDFVKKFKELS